MKVDVLDQTGKIIDQVELRSEIFEATINPALVAQAIRVRLTNARTGTASTKTRSMVRGGGRKPWKQKGTGRARQGSIRAPQWRGGGIVHGPHPFKPHLNMPQAMRRAALFSALTDKVLQKSIIIIDQIQLEKPRTNLMSQIIKLIAPGQSTLIVMPAKSDLLEQSTRNIPHVKTLVARVLHPYEVLQHQTVVILKESLPVLEETFLSTRTKEADEDKKEKKTAKRTASKATIKLKSVKEGI